MNMLRLVVKHCCTTCRIAMASITVTNEERRCVCMCVCVCVCWHFAVVPVARVVRFFHFGRNDPPVEHNVCPWVVGGTPRCRTG